MELVYASFAKPRVRTRLKRQKWEVNIFAGFWSAPTCRRFGVRRPVAAVGDRYQSGNRLPHPKLTKEMNHTQETSSSSAFRQCKYRLAAASFLTLLILAGFKSALAVERYSLPRQELVRSEVTKDETKDPPSAKRIRTRKVDIKHIGIDLRFDWQKKKAYGATSVTLTALEPIDLVTLDAGMLSIDSIIMVKGPHLEFDYDGSDKNDNLRITLDRTYNAGAEVTIRISYSTNHVNRPDPGSLGGTDGKGLRFSEPTSNDPTRMREIWSMGDPESNRYWFPSYDSPDDLRTTEFAATVERKFTVISNGRLLETKDNPDGTRTFRWKSDTPYANHLTSFAIGEFADVRQKYQDVELHNFGSPRERDWVAASVERLPDMVRFFSEKTGVKYPYQTYSQVFVQEIGAFTGKPNLNFATITENMVDDFATHADYFYLWDLTEAEALAGQWFGGYVTAKEWSDVWLNKGFAHYFNCLYNENKNGRDEWLLWVHSFDHGSYLGEWSSGNRHPIVTKHYENSDVFTTDSYATIRGGLVLNMLRKHLGEELWWKAIRRYLRSHAHKTVVTDDFRRAIEKTSDQPFEWFFNQWVYKMGHPIFEVTKNYTDGKLVLIVKQTQKTDPNTKFPQVEFFQGNLEIEIDGRVEQVRLEPRFENVFTFALPGQPKFVNFDFQSTWIKEIKFEKSFDELLNQFQSSKDVLARQSAMIELAAIAKNEKSSAADKDKVQTALRSTILGNDYWRLRNAALSQLVGLYPVGSLDDATIALLLSVIKKDKSWVRASAIGFLGTTREAKYADTYLDALNDESFRVINAAAIAIGRSKSPKAFDALAKLKDKPSMKSQSLISALAGLKALGDPRGYEIAFNALADLNLPRWRLSSIPPTWDYRDFAVDTIASMNKGDDAYPLVLERFKRSISEDDLNGIFANVLLITSLADPRGQEVFELLKEKFKNDGSTLSVVVAIETEFQNAVNKAAQTKSNGSGAVKRVSQQPGMVVPDANTVFKDENENVITASEFVRRKSSGDYIIVPEVAGGKLVAVALKKSGTKAVRPTPSDIEWDKKDPVATVPEPIKRETFEQVWATVNDSYFDPTFNGVDWQAVKAKYELQVKAVKSNQDLTELLNRMLGDLRKSHLRIVPAGFFTTNPNLNTLDVSNTGSVGISVRVLSGSEIVITGVRDHSPAHKAGVRKGFTIKTIDGQTISEIVANHRRRGGFQARDEVVAVRAVVAKLSGDLRQKVSMLIVDENNTEKLLELDRQYLGIRTDIGFESRRLREDAGYIKFDVFSGDLLGKFEAAINDLRETSFLVIDLRANPGGVANYTTAIAAMLDKEKRSLGTTKYRHTVHHFNYEGNDKSYRGKIFVLIDELSGSSSEVLAAGLQSHKRVFVIGQNSAGAVLPSTLQPLPTGGALQYALGDFQTPDGKDLEGKGVTPDVEVKRTRKDLLEGKDVSLEMALRLAQNAGKSKQ
jgi:aminopeptidase N